MIDLLKGYFKIQDRDDLREIREKVTGKLLTLDDSLKPTLPAFLALLDVPSGRPRVAERSTRGSGASARSTPCKRLLLREAREQPLLLIFEDLHWIDSETQALLDSLVDSLGSARLLLLVNYRPEYKHAWGSKTYYSQMRLDALPAESAGELLRPPRRRCRARTAQAAGRRARESVLPGRERPDAGGDEGPGGRARGVSAGATGPDDQVPATVQAMLAARIDRLSPEDKRLLQAASVIGKDVPFALLQAIAELPDEALRRGLDHLQAAEFLYETRLFPDLEYTFKHALTHEVTYGSLLQERRRELHARIVDAIETLHRDRLGEQIERLAHHAFRGEMWEKAVHYSGRRVRRLPRARRTGRRWRARAGAGRLVTSAESRATLAQAIDIRFELRNALIALGEVRGRSRVPARG